MEFEMNHKTSEPQRLQRKPSIETEPKTLLREEMNAAREAALKVINSKTKEEALRIFLEGKKSVAGEEQVREFEVGTD